MRIKRFFVVLIGIALIGIFGCSKKTDNAEQPVKKPNLLSVKIGVVAPYEGPNAHIGQMIMNSVKLYFQEHPLQGVKLELVPLDTKSNPPDAVAAMQSAVPDPKLIALIAFYHSSTALACKQIIREAKLPTIIYSASNPAVTDDAPYYFRLVPTDDNQAIVLTDYAKQLGASKVAILYYADEYGKGLSDGIQARAKTMGINVVYAQSYDATTSDFRPMLTVLKSKSPKVVIICGFVDKSIVILNQAVEKGLNATFLAGDGTFNEEELIQGAGANAEGVYVAAPYVFDENNPKNAAFLKAYLAAYDKTGSNRKPASWSAFAYDASGILANAFQEGHQSRDSIYQYLVGMNAKEKGYDGITGLTYFNKKGDAVGRNFRLALVKNKKFVAAE